MNDGRFNIKADGFGINQ